MEELFEYDNSIRAANHHSTIHSSPYFEIEAISIPSPIHGDIPGYFIMPSGEGPFPAVLFLHPAVKTKDHFLADARKLARLGFASLLIDAPMARPEPLRQAGSLAHPERERELYQQTVLDLRRCIDFLESSAKISQEKIGFVGQNYGAALGAVLAGVDKRIKAYVLIAGIPNLARFWEKSNRPVAVETRAKYRSDQIARYVEMTEDLAGTKFIGKASPASVFFQFGKQDSWITKGMAIQFYDAASAPKKIRFYDTDHAFDCPEASQEYMQWLQAKLAG